MLNLLMEDMTLEHDYDEVISIVQYITNKEFSKGKNVVRIKDYFENVIPSYPKPTFKLHF